MGRGWLRFTDHIDNLVHGSSRAAGDDDGGENYFAAAFVAALGKEFGGPEGRADEVSCTRMLRALSAHRTTVTAATATFTCPLGCALLCWSVCRPSMYSLRRSAYYPTPTVCARQSPNQLLCRRCYICCFSTIFRTLDPSSGAGDCCHTERHM
eukprot:1147333-Pelagomonas_calceolata.AAC.5